MALERMHDDCGRPQILHLYLGGQHVLKEALLVYCHIAGNI